MTDVAFYERLRDSTATPLIDRFGAQSLYRRTTEVYDPDTGTTQTVNFDTVVSAVRDEFAVSMVDGDTVLAGDFIVYISAGELGIQPLPGDYVFFGSTSEDNSSRYRVIRPTPINPGGIGVVYGVQVRR